MKQLYCTSGDRSNNGATPGEAGARVRAASAGLTPDRVQAVLRYAGYASPPRGPAAKAEAPARLALLRPPTPAVRRRRSAAASNHRPLFF